MVEKEFYLITERSSFCLRKIHYKIAKHGWAPFGNEGFTWERRKEGFWKRENPS